MNASMRLARIVTPMAFSRVMRPLSHYMGGFQARVRGGRFRIEFVISHHDRMLAEWTLLGPDNAVLQTGRSFATVNADGRLKSITGFFDVEPRRAA